MDAPLLDVAIVRKTCTGAFEAERLPLSISRGGLLMVFHPSVKVPPGAGPEVKVDFSLMVKIPFERLAGVLCGPSVGCKGTNPNLP